MTPILENPGVGAPFTLEQQEYLTGLFAGVVARGQQFKDVERSPMPIDPGPAPVFEERVKQELNPLDAHGRLLEKAASNEPPDKEDAFRFKWNGLFYLSPIHNAYMARLRIPGGVVKSFQLREIARTAQELTTGYVQITTRANFQIRLIQPKDAPEVLRRIQSVGLHTRGAGADNIRNITANPTAGIDPQELIDVLPYCLELAHQILNDRSFYDLPRKFNIAFDGGGLIGTVEDTNDIGARAVLTRDGVMFRIALGGATGHQAFARDLGVIVQPADLNRVIVALVRVFIEHGNRGNRKKARLKHLLDTWSLEQYLEKTEDVLGHRLQRDTDTARQARAEKQQIAHSHLGVFPQKQPGLSYIGVAVPVGQLTPAQLLQLADIVERFGGGEIRLTVWQNLILPNVPERDVAKVVAELKGLGLETQQSKVRGGLVACTGNSYCKFASANTKGHALELADYLDKAVTLDLPINIHVTGCPHSCAQHYMGDIGLLGTKVGGKEAYHVFIGGGFGSNQAVGRQLLTGVLVDDLKLSLEKLLKGYLQYRVPGESFQQFTQRNELTRLAGLLTE